MLCLVKKTHYLKELTLFWAAFSLFLQCQNCQTWCCCLFITHIIHVSVHISTDFSGFFSCLLNMLNHSHSTNAGCDFLLPNLLKSNLSDFTYDGLKQVSVFKALKVMWEKWLACTDHICVSPSAPLKGTTQHLVMIIKRADWIVLVCMKMDDCLFSVFLCCTLLPWYLLWYMIFHLL